MHYKMTLLLGDFNPPAGARLYRVPFKTVGVNPTRCNRAGANVFFTQTIRPDLNFDTEWLRKCDPLL